VVRDALPRAPTGHVLVTSRNPAWGGIAQALPLDRWPREESVRFLRERSGKADDRAADRVADALGDLPLALEQAAAYCEQTGTTLTDYADLLEQGYGAELWQEPRDLERTVAAVWEVSFSKVEADSPAAAALLQLCAFLAPDDIPLGVIRDGADILPEPLKAAATRPVAFNTAVGALLRYSLARRDGEALSVHRLVQAVTRDRLIAEEHGRWAERAATLMNNALPSFPHGAFDAEVATLYDRLQPHALAAAEHAEARGVALEAVARLFNEIGGYRWMRADLATARAAYQRALAIDEKAFGPDHPSVAIRVNNLGMVLKDLGDLDGARKAFQRALVIFEKVLGADHQHTQTVRSNLAALAAHPSWVGRLSSASSRPPPLVLARAPGPAVLAGGPFHGAAQI
jgi:tetratricopeptide (TPR) repeat protein